MLKKAASWDIAHNAPKCTELKWRRSPSSLYWPNGYAYLVDTRKEWREEKKAYYRTRLNKLVD